MTEAVIPDVFRSGHVGSRRRAQRVVDDTGDIDVQIRQYALAVSREFKTPFRDIGDLPLWLWRQYRKFLDDLIRERSREED